MTTVNDMMAMFKEAEGNSLITINDSDALEKWLHDDQGYQYLEEMKS